MKPYYQDKWVTIYHGDCREILPQLDVKVDLVLTDPPYGIDYQSARRTAWDRKPKIQGDSEFPLWIFDLIKPTSAWLIFCRWDILPILPQPKSFIVWDKGTHSMGNLEHEYGRQWEAIAFYPQARHEFAYRPIDIIRAMRIPPDKLIHPNEKPEGVVSPLITANKGDLILDPFLGSGTTCYCAKKLNRYSIGIEIEEKYCEIAARRCSQEVMELI
ncbi:MAG: site-specific DNA-methyltransferase [Dehalococcoidia bacterium]|nr:site-specific DNA-methyltransferase [Dehalococcoidia bacterium]